MYILSGAGSYKGPFPLSLMVSLQEGKGEENWEQAHRLPGRGKVGISVTGSSCLLTAPPRKIRGFLAQVPKTYWENTPPPPSPWVFLLQAPFADRWFKKKKFFFVFPGLHLRHMEVPRLEVKSELQLLAYSTATATWYPRCIFDLHHSSQQCCIPNPPSEARDWTCNFMDTSQIFFPCATMRTPKGFNTSYKVQIKLFFSLNTH